MFAANDKLLDAGRVKKHGVHRTMDNVDSFLGFGRDSDLCWTASSCPPHNPRQDGCPNIQPTFCALSGGFRCVKYQKLKMTLVIIIIRSGHRDLFTTEYVDHFS